MHVVGNVRATGRMLEWRVAQLFNLAARGTYDVTVRIVRADGFVPGRAVRDGNLADMPATNQVGQRTVHGWFGQFWQLLDCRDVQLLSRQVLAAVVQDLPDHAPLRGQPSIARAQMS